MRIRRSIATMTNRTLRTKFPIALACVAGLVAGACLTSVTRPTPALADDGKPAHGQPPIGAKAPIQEILHCPLSFAGVHLLKDLPEHPQVAYHYCKAVNDDVNQCVLYDGTGSDAKLIGIECLASIRIPGRRLLFFPDASAGCYSAATGLGRPFLACSTR